MSAATAAEDQRQHACRDGKGRRDLAHRVSRQGDAIAFGMHRARHGGLCRLHDIEVGVVDLRRLGGGRHGRFGARRLRRGRLGKHGAQRAEGLLHARQPRFEPARSLGERLADAAFPLAAVDVERLQGFAKRSAWLAGRDGLRKAAQRAHTRGQAFGIEGELGEALRLQVLQVHVVFVVQLVDRRGHGQHHHQQCGAAQHDQMAEAGNAGQVWRGGRRAERAGH